MVKILQETEAEHMPEADGHIRITGKVKINLESIGRDPDPGCQDRHIARIHHTDLVPQNPRLIGQKNLFAQPDHKAVDALGEFLHALFPGAQLRVDGPVLDDRPRNQLGEHGHISPVGYYIFLDGSIRPVYVNDIGDCLECVK